MGLGLVTPNSLPPYLVLILVMYESKGDQHWPVGRKRSNNVDPVRALVLAGTFVPA